MATIRKPTPEEVEELDRLEAELVEFLEEIQARAEASLVRIRALRDRVGGDR